MNSVTWLRDDLKVQPTARLDKDQYTAGEELADVLDLWRDDIETTDTLYITGTINVGETATLLMPECKYLGKLRNGERTTRLLTERMIDTAPASTMGFSLQSYSYFKDIYFGGVCHNPLEDGGLMGWASQYKLSGAVTFENCEIDASGHDWGVYSWEPLNITRSVTMIGGVGRFCRQLIALPASGGGTTQNITMTDVMLYGDAQGSRSQGTTSGPDVTNGGVLSPVVNRLGTTVMTRCISEIRGRTTTYDGGLYGCPRIVALATNRYNNSSGTPTSFTFNQCKVRSIFNGNSEAQYDIDVRGSGTVTINYDADDIAAAPAEAQAVLDYARGGTGVDGYFRTYQ